MVTREKLERLYEKYNNRENVRPDPLQFLYDYPQTHDREVAGMVASALAYGRVALIIRNVALVLGKMGARPRDFLMEADDRELEHMMDGFRHRFTDGPQVAFLLSCIKRSINKYGSLNQCFLSGFCSDDENVAEGIRNFISSMTCRPDDFCSSLLPAAAGKSALKRFNLYLRWMVRCDDVDPGGWMGVDASKLIVPLDTHMHKISLKLGLTSRKQADMKTALEITRAFKKINPADPVRYDFALTRLGIKKCDYIF